MSQLDTNVFIDTIKIDTTGNLQDTMVSYNYDPVILNADDPGKIHYTSVERPFFMEAFQNSLKGKYLDWILGILILVLIILAWSKKSYGKYIGQIVNSMFNTQLAGNLYRDSNIILRKVSFLFNFIYLVVVSMFIFELFLYHEISLFKQEKIWQFAIVLGVISGLFIFKYLSIKFVGFIFQMGKEFDEYFFNVTLYNKAMGLFLLPIVAIIPYVASFLVFPLQIIGISILIASTLLKYARGFKIIISKGILLFYLILYLCTFEILPVLYLYKFFVSKI